MAEKVASQSISPSNDVVHVRTASSFNTTETVELKDVASEKQTTEWTAWETAYVRLHLLTRGLCCRSKPRLRWVGSKGAILILLWNCLIPDVMKINHFFVEAVEVLKLNKYIDILLPVALIHAISLILLYPLAGWLADVYFGRYRVIKASLWLIWFGALLFCCCVCLFRLLPQSNLAVKIVLIPPALLALEIGIAGFGANVIPFGLDQLQSESGDQMRAFITWFVFTTAIKYSFPIPNHFCPWLPEASDNVLIQVMVLLVLISIALVIDFFFKELLVMEPGTANPLKLVINVLKYAWRTKRPQQRSAFTYLDQKKPSRIEYGKPLYGGPFTTEQVEDVKTFLKITSALLTIGAGMAVCNLTLFLYSLFSTHIEHHSLSCYGFSVLSTNLHTYTVLLVIPIYELLIYPRFYNYMPSMLARFGIGVLLCLICDIGMFILTVMTGASETCIFDGNRPFGQIQTSPFWTLPSQIIMGFGMYFMLTAGYEFVFAQAPHNMKGLLMGTSFAANGLFLFILLILLLPLYSTVVKYMMHSFSCWAIYFLFLLILGFIWFIVYVCVARRYQRRERDDTKRYQNYNEEYFIKYLGRNK